MSLVRCLSLRSMLNARRYRSSSSCLIHLPTRRDEDEATRQNRSYHSFIIHQSWVTGGSSFSRNLSAFRSPAIASSRFISTLNFSGSVDSVRVLADWVLQSAVSNAYALHNVADALDSLQALLNSFTFSQWWVCIIVTSLLIRGVTIPDMIDLLNTIANFFKSVGSATTQGEENLAKVSILGKSRRVMYTMLQKDFAGVKGSIVGQGILVPVFWFSMEELRRNIVDILVSLCLRGKTFSGELIRKGVLSRGRLVVVVGDGFGFEIQMFDLDIALIMKRRQVL